MLHSKLKEGCSASEVRTSFYDSLYTYFYMLSLIERFAGPLKVGDSLRWHLDILCADLLMILPELLGYLCVELCWTHGEGQQHGLLQLAVNDHFVPPWP